MMHPTHSQAQLRNRSVSPQEYVVPDGEGPGDDSTTNTSKHYQGITVGEKGQVLGVMAADLSFADGDGSDALYIWDADGSNFRFIRLYDLDLPNELAVLTEEGFRKFFVFRSILWTGSSPALRDSDSDGDDVADDLDECPDSDLGATV